MGKLKFEKHSREWLNPIESYDTGSLQTSVTVDAEDSAYVDADFSLRDCSRSVSITFTFWDEKSFEERVAKIETIIDSLQEMKESMITCRNLCKDRWIKLEEIRKQEEEKEANSE